MRLEHIRCLNQSSHEGYDLLRCPECGQVFLHQFQEITWLPNGEDDIWLRWVPLTPDEATEIERLFPEETEDDGSTHVLANLMHRRNRLVRDPLGRFSWSDEPWDAGNLYPPG